MNTVTDAITIRALARGDLDAVVAIDAAIEGHSRRAYFERRLQAALREPELHAQLAAVDAKGLAGYILARVLEGEFGHSERGLRIEVVSVRADVQGRGVGRRLFDALAQWARRHGVRDLRTHARWDDHPMIRWIDAMGFEMAPSQVLDCPVHAGSYLPARDDAREAPGGDTGGQEISYGAADGNDFEHLARDSAEVGSIRPDDLPEIVRIDRQITGRDRAEYVERKMNETLADSAIRVSLAARLDGAVAGFLMARADLGDFGRTEPVAVIDTIGVHPGYAHRGVGRALMSQLFVNLGALRIDRVETVVGPRDFGLTGFLLDIGFAPSQRLAFERRLD